MADGNVLADRIMRAHAFFCRTIDCFTAEDEAFAPAEGAWTVAQQIAHTAQTVDWFVDGAWSETGVDMDFGKHAAEVSRVTTLAAATEWLERSFGRAVETLRKASPEELDEPQKGAIFNGVPRSGIAGGIIDHTAHHRGSLAVYARLCGKTPSMPYA